MRAPISASADDLRAGEVQPRLVGGGAQPHDLRACVAVARVRDREDARAQPRLGARDRSTEAQVPRGGG